MRVGVHIDITSENSHFAFGIVAAFVVRRAVLGRARQSRNAALRRARPGP